MAIEDREWPRLSGRVPSSLTPTILAVTQREARGRGAVDLTVTNPTTCGFDYPRRLAEILARAATRPYEPDPRGPATTREAIARSGPVPMDPDRVVVTASTSESYGLLLRTLCDPGDPVAVARPGYPLLDQLATQDGVPTLGCRWRWGGGRWELDLGSVERALAGGARALFMVSPNNPTGSVLSESEALGLRERCDAQGIPLVVDEVFWPYGSGAQRAVSVVERPGLDPHDGAPLVILDGLSKRLALPQIKLGWMTVFGDPRAARRLMDGLTHVNDAYLSASTPAHGVAEALLPRWPVTDQILGRLEGNEIILRDALADAPEVSVGPREGGWMILVRVPAVRSDEDWALWLARQAGVLVAPGFLYDLDTGCWLVVSLLAPEGVFGEGARRLVAGVRAGLASVGA